MPMHGPDRWAAATLMLCAQERVYRTLGREPATLARRPRHLGFEQ